MAGAIASQHVPWSTTSHVLLAQRMVPAGSARSVVPKPQVSVSQVPLASQHVPWSTTLSHVLLAQRLVPRRAWGSGYLVSVDGGRTEVWARSIREVTRLFNEAGLTISASTVHAIQSQRDDREAGRLVTRKIQPLPAWADFEAVGVRGERESQ